MNDSASTSHRTLSPAQVSYIDHVGNIFDAAWQAARQGGPRPRIEDHSREADAVTRPALLRELVELDIAYRRLAGESLVAADYLERFPELSSEIQKLAVSPPKQPALETQHGGPPVTQTAGIEAPTVLPDSVSPAPGDTQPTVPPTSPPSVPIHPATWPTIPGFEILGELGRGGMGVVYQARQVALNRLVAIKTLLPGAQASPEDRERFLREAQAVARLQHPNIVQIFEIGQQNGLPYFSMEYVEGGTLARRLDGTPLRPKEAARVVKTLARAVHAAHQAGIVHRDLKPANVLLGKATAEDAEGAEDPSAPSAASAASFFVPKLTDFGLAKRTPRITGSAWEG